ncbi:MAG: DUF2804 domain-containing protein [Christensenellales bacterium]|jgi:hypothetical protein
MQHRILSQGPLHRTDGALSETGYSTSLMKTYDRKLIKAPRWRIKEWDYYLVCNDSFALALTIADNGYMGLDSVSLLDFDTKRQLTHSAVSLFPMGSRQLPVSSLEGASRAVGKGYEINFVVNRGKRELYGQVEDMQGSKKKLLFDLSLADPVQDSMVIVIPFHGKPDCFYYNQKINCLPAEGRVILDGQDYYFSPATSFGVLDWGRGVWPYSNTWYWGSASGVVNGRAFGLNIGHGFGDTSKATENMMFYGGKAHKLERVIFTEPLAKRKSNYLATWQLYDDAGRLKLAFEPILDRSADMNVFVLASRQHQVFGRFYGSALLDDGHLLTIEGLTGFLEKVTNKW